MRAAISTQDLTKTYGDFTAVDRLTLSVYPGEVFGFLGPNGAGKTTTIRMLMGILTATSGRAEMLGLPCLEERVELKRSVGYLPDSPAYYDYLRGREILTFVGGMHGIKGDDLTRRCGELLEQVGLVDAANEYAMNYSTGMKKRLALACALIHRPSILILDEPTAGLDPIAANQIRSIMRDIAASGRTVFLSTHLLDMASKLCTRVGIIHEGALKTVGAPSELQSKLVEGGSLEDVFFRTTGSTTDADTVE